MVKRRSASSARWLREHHADRFVRDARSQGYRSRASFKLLQVQEKEKLIRSGQVIVDLGAAPGGWSQVAAQLTGKTGKVVATDILAMEHIEGVDFLQGDFTETPIFDALLERLRGRPVDLVLSDMAPNMSGMRDVDQARAMHLAELALDLSRKVLKKGGNFVCKLFQGEGFDAFVKELRRDFSRVRVRKPDASRGRSREVYAVATGFINGRDAASVVE